MKNILVKYQINCGEYEYYDHVVLGVKKGESKVDVLHKYFKGFAYDLDKEDMEKARYYTYNGCEQAVSIRDYEFISDEELKTLIKLGLN